MTNAQCCATRQIRSGSLRIHSRAKGLIFKGQLIATNAKKSVKGCCGEQPFEKMPERKGTELSAPTGSKLQPSQ